MLDRWQSVPWLRDLPIGESTAGALLRRQLHIGIEGDGRMSQRRVVGHTDAARQLLAGETGQAVTQKLRGMLSTLDGTEGANNLKGIAFATDPDGWLVNSTLRELEAIEADDGALLTPPDDAGAAAALGRRIAQRRPAAEAGTWNNVRGWINVGARDSAPLLRLLQGQHADPDDPRSERDSLVGSRQALALSHELTHSVTPETPGITPPPGAEWIEEGAADVVSVLRAPETAAAMQLPHSDADIQRHVKGDYGYRDWRRGVAHVVNLAGIDYRTPAGRKEALELLQRSPDERLADDLAAAVAQQHQLPAPARDQLRSMLLAADARPAAFEHVHAFIRANSPAAVAR